MKKENIEIIDKRREMKKYIILGIVCAIIIVLNIPLIDKCQQHEFSSSDLDKIKEIKINSEEGTFAENIVHLTAFYNGKGWQTERSLFYEYVCEWHIEMEEIKTFTGHIQLEFAQYRCEKKYLSQYTIIIRYRTEDDFKIWNPISFHPENMESENVESKKISFLQHFFFFIKKMGVLK